MLIDLSPESAVLASAAVWAVLGTLTGYLMHRVPVTRLAHGGRLTRLRAWEAGGRVYERRLRIRRWKRWLPEGGATFRGGFSKRHLRGRSAAHLGRFVAETRRAELTHWAVMAYGPLFFLWTPWWVGAVMVTFGIAANLPCLLVQRYNRARLERLLARHQPVH